MHSISSAITAVPQPDEAAPGSVRRTRSWPRILGRACGIALLSALVLLVIGQTVWLYSGSNEWRFVGEQNGVKVYMLKAPGADLEQAKGVFRVHSTLGGIVSFMTSADTCQKVGCYGQQMLEQPDPQLNFNYFRMDLPGPFRTRDFVVRQQISQTPSTKEVMIDYSAAPGKAPLNSCCVRVTSMHDTWRLTPVPGGEVEIEMVMNVNEGGFIPHALLNLARPSVLYQLSDLQQFFNEDRYRTAKLAFIAEP